MRRRRGLAVGLWEALVAVRPGYAAMFMGDPYRPGLYRWALGALAATVVTTWYVALRRRVGAVPLAIGALVWPAVLGAVTAWLIPSMSYRTALPAATAGAGALAALSLGERHPAWRIVALTAGAAPGAVLLVLGGATLLGVLGIALGAVGVFYFTLAGLLALSLVELAMPARRALLPGVAAILTVALSGAGLAVDRFDGDHPRLAHLLYSLDADAGTATWASEDGTPHRWVTDRAPERRAEDVRTLPLPYGTEPTWTGTAPVVALEPPELTVVDSRSDGEANALELRVASRREADIIVLHTDRPVLEVTVAAGGHPPVTSSPTFTGGRGWLYELRLYDPPPGGFRVTVRMAGSEPVRVALSDYTVGLDQVPGFRPRPAGLERSPAHSSDLVVVGTVHDVSME